MDREALSQAVRETGKETEMNKHKKNDAEKD